MNYPLILGVFGIIAFLYILALIVSTIRNSPIDSIINLNEVQARIRQANPAFEWLVPLGLGLAFTYNAFASAFWIIGLAVKGVTWLISLVITQFLIPGPWLVIKVIFHYFIYRPWQLVRESFRNLNANWNWSQFKVALATLSVVFFLNYLGQTIYTLDNDLAWAQVSLNALSFIVLAIGFVKLVNSVQSSEIPFFYRRVLTYASGLVGLWVVLGIVQLGLVRLATFSTWSETLVSIIHGGGLTLSFLILINAIYLLFTLLALPGFLSNFEGNWTEFIPEFGKYIWRKGWDLAFVIPSGFLAAVLLTVVPYIVLSGVNNLTKYQQSSALESRIDKLQSQFNKLSNQIDRSTWMTLKEEELENQFALDLDAMDISMQIAVLESSTGLNASLTSNLDDDFGLLPIKSVAFFYGSLQESISNLVPGFLADNRAYAAQKELRESTLSSAQISVEQIDALRARAEALKQRICYPNASKKKLNQPDTTTTIRYPNEEESIDDCQLAEIRLDELNQKLARAQKINEHEVLAVARVSGKASMRGASSFISIILFGVWGSVLWAIALSLALTLYARLLHFINQRDTEPYLVNTLRNQENPNQPTLALLILGALIALSVSAFGSASFGLNLVDSASINLPNYSISNEEVTEAITTETSVVDDALEREGLLIDLLHRIPDIDDSDLVQELEPAMDEPGNQEEITQTSGSKKSKFTCKNGTYIELAWIGDGECDCADCEDEN